MADNENIHKGHRKHVRERYYKSGLESMPDHNVLELLLFFGIPYKDTNPIAHALIEKFGSFSAVFQASVNELMSVKGMTENAACLINLFLPVYRRFSHDLLSKTTSLLTTEEIVEFIKPQFFGCTYEKLYILCFDSSHSLITVRELSRGDITSAGLDFRLMATIVLESKAHSVVLVHNHPNGISLPSQADVEATKTAYSLLNTLKVDLMNHIIICDNGFSSMIDIPKFIPIFFGRDEM